MIALLGNHSKYPFDNVSFAELGTTLLTERCATVSEGVEAWLLAFLP